MRWFCIKPFKYAVYNKWRDRRIVRFLKPDWRGWLYRKLLAVEEELRRLREEAWSQQASLSDLKTRKD
ncbi:hypothetical protein [Pyrodictium delaneyi]|uniref:Uncharacterized protein n=1 Tax=Pyrodictium delaneyi TaxID=1273541 RepID=A0A211YP20_9CREN|nr:hypothetical protein [Pyrodictium delaneyi]OWJ54729.1 hypothetical protein Pdsh_03095 [Pyrodictium delaneyi]